MWPLPCVAEAIRRGVFSGTAGEGQVRSGFYSRRSRSSPCSQRSWVPRKRKTRDQPAKQDHFSPFCQSQRKGKHARTFPQLKHSLSLELQLSAKWPTERVVH